MVIKFLTPLGATSSNPAQLLAGFVLGIIRVQLLGLECK